MWIEQLNIEAFGKLQNVQMQFAPGLTVIYGANESGKSTVMAFVRAMLYGLNGRSASLKLNDRKRCMPWGRTSMGGGLRLCDGQSVYEIFRTFGQTKKLDTCRVVDALTGEVVPIPAGEEPGQVLLGVDEAVFADTLFISWQGNRLTGDGVALGEKIRNRIGTGEEDVDLQKLLGRLHAARSGIVPRVREKGLLHETRVALDEARRELMRCAERRERVAQLRGEIEHLVKMDEQSLTISKRMDAHEKAVQALHAGHVREAELSERIRALQKQADVERKRRRWGIGCMVLGALTAITGGAAGALSNRLWLLALLPAVGLAVTGVLLRRRESTQGQEELMALQTRRVQVQADNERLDQSVCGMAEDLEREFAKRAPQKEKTQLLNARVELEGLLREQKSEDALKERIAALENRERELQTAAAALDMAQQELQNAARERQSGFAPEVVRAMEDMLRQATDGKYEHAAISRSLEVSLQGENGALQPWAYFSTGTVELMYLALRLSLAQLLCRRNGALPMMLDDPFLCMDDARALQCLMLVQREMRGERQALLFTCRREPARSGGVRVVPLES